MVIPGGTGSGKFAAIFTNVILVYFIFYFCFILYIYFRNRKLNAFCSDGNTRW